MTPLHPLVRVGRALWLFAALLIGAAAYAALLHPVAWLVIGVGLVLLVAARVIERAGDRIAALERVRAPLSFDPSRLRPDTAARR